MSANARPTNGYGDATRALGTPRSVEYQVFSQVTGQLSRATAPNRPFTDLASALHDNIQLWTTLAADLAGDDNGLTPKLRGQLLSLAQFTRAHSSKVLRREADAGVLIEINTAIMRGLRGEPTQTGG